MVGVDVVGGDDFAGVEVDDRDGDFVDEGDDSFVSVLAPIPRWCIRTARRRLIDVVADMVAADPAVAFAGLCEVDPAVVGEGWGGDAVFAGGGEEGGDSGSCWGRCSVARRCLVVLGNKRGRY